MGAIDFDAIKDKAGDLVQSGINKSKEIVEITRLKVANRSEEDAVKKACIEIGKLYYAERGLSPEPAYAALCEKVTASKSKIEENKKRIDQLRSEGNISEDELAQAEADAEAEAEQGETPATEEAPAAEEAAEAPDPEE